VPFETLNVLWGALETSADAEGVDLLANRLPAAIAEALIDRENRQDPGRFWPGPPLCND
jgi:hypothetical protein